ncbi:MAG: TonB-dependent receptor [Pseudomonadota bacterium]
MSLTPLLTSYFRIFTSLCLALLLSFSVYAEEVSLATAIDAQPLGTALNTLSELTDVVILAPTELVEGHTSGAVPSGLSALEAARMMVSGAGLSVVESDSGALVVKAGRPTAPATSVMSPQLKVEEVVVYGTKQGVSIQETFASAEVLTMEALQERAMYELADVMLRTPNVSGDGSLFSTSIRGVSSQGVGGAGTGRTTNVYLDGAPASNNALPGIFNLWDVAQVEVLRGPQATTQGRNALAGAIVMQSADPEFEPSGRVRVLGGNQETYEASVMATGPLIDEQVAFRLAYDYREQDFGGFNVPVQQNDQFTESTTARAKLLIVPEALPDLRAEFNLSWTDLLNAGRARRVISPPGDDPARDDFDPFELENWDARGGIVDNESIRFITDLGYQLSDVWRVQFLATADQTERVIQNAGGDDIRDEETYSLDFRLHFDTQRLQGWIGAYYFNEDTDLDSTLVVDPTDFGFQTEVPGTLLSSVSALSREIENYALYGDLSYQLTDRLTVRVGARYDVEDVFDTGQNAEVTFSVVPCNVVLGPILIPCDNFLSSSSGTPLDTDYDAFLPLAAVIYDIDDYRSVSFTVQRGYRAGGADTVFGVVGEFDPEFITNYELAFRSTWLDERLTVNANVFYADWEDQQLQVPVGPARLEFDTVNAGESELYGAEITVSYLVGGGFNIYAGLGLLETEFVDFPFAIDDNGNPLPGAPGFANLAGNEFSGAPNTTFSLGGSYEHSSGIFASLNLAYRDEQFSDIENLEANQVGDYWLANARLGFERNALRISAYGNNLFDEEIFTGRVVEGVFISDDGTVSIGQPGFDDYFIAQPRQYGLELEYRF